MITFTSWNKDWDGLSSEKGSNKDQPPLCLTAACIMEIKTYPKPDTEKRDFSISGKKRRDGETDGEREREKEISHFVFSHKPPLVYEGLMVQSSTLFSNQNYTQTCLQE